MRNVMCQSNSRSWSSMTSSNAKFGCELNSCSMLNFKRAAVQNLNAATAASTCQSTNMLSLSTRCTLSTLSLGQRPLSAGSLVGPMTSWRNSNLSSKLNFNAAFQRRGLYDYVARSYAADQGFQCAAALSTVSSGVSPVSLSLLVAPWKALPMALFMVPMVYITPAVYRMLFTNCSRGSVNALFQGFCQFILTFLPVPSYENLFAELTFYITALFLTFFIYNFFPELMLEDGIWIFYSALFVMPFLPLAFSYMPTFLPRSFLVL